MPFTNHYVSCSAGITISKECLPEGVFKQFTPTVLETVMRMILMLWGKKLKNFLWWKMIFQENIHPCFSLRSIFYSFYFLKH